MKGISDVSTVLTADCRDRRRLRQHHVARPLALCAVGQLREPVSGWPLAHSLLHGCCCSPFGSAFTVSTLLGVVGANGGCHAAPLLAPGVGLEPAAFWYVS